MRLIPDSPTKQKYLRIKWQPVTFFRKGEGPQTPGPQAQGPQAQGHLEVREFASL